MFIKPKRLDEQEAKPTDRVLFSITVRKGQPSFVFDRMSKHGIY